MKRLLHLHDLLRPVRRPYRHRAVKLTKDEIARRVAAAMPAEFTGAKIKRPMSDAAHGGLKGKVGWSMATRSHAPT